MRIRPLLLFASLAFASTGCAVPTASREAPVSVVETPGPIRDKGYELIFREEFDGKAGDAPDPKKWSPRLLGPWRDGVNVADTCRLDGKGNLVIAVRRNGDKVETGEIGTQGKFSATHGYFECRCKFQKAEGFWSAFWLQSPTIGKPVGDPVNAGVEIDVIEYLAVKWKDTALHNCHWDGYDDKFHKKDHAKKRVPGLSEGFHTFAVKWDEAGYVFFTDGMESGRMTKTPISNRPQFLILSCEVGPWAGDIKKAALPDAFTVDYVRAWQTPAQREADKARAAARKRKP